MSFTHVLWLASLTIPIVGAVVGVRAACIEVRDNVDAFIDDIKRQSRWATWAAVLSSISALLGAVVNWNAG